MLYMSCVQFSYGGYAFRVVETLKSFYPKYFGMVGVCDDQCRIAYVYFCDLDLDFIENMADFMKEEIRYQW
ncbi:MAG TPA: hypothetical protein PLJ33_02250 [Peptococcaceae bacterium]|nr:hypothetical protein [Clostridia bacterium]HOB81758.1 hypothetical protein [Peptococcaceae bacterium]HPZ70866.1 hypothetical protein [Peptococcaceae bacterium]HQD53663.1 hypothetical protein [Peptococcaceae bacterium]